MRDVVITVGTAPGSALALAKGIRKRILCRVFVLCTDEKTSRIIGSSKYIDEIFLISNTSDEEYLREIKDWRRNFKFEKNPLLYFTSDTACFLIDREREWFMIHFELCLPSSDIVQSFTQKGIAEVKALEAGLTVPKTQIIDTNGDIEIIKDTFKFPVILKPRATYLKNNVNFKIKVVYDKSEFESITTNLIIKGNTLLCQEFIPGSDNDSFYYLFHRSEKGTIYRNMGRKILQSSPSGGIMAKGLVEYSNELENISKNFLNRINYVGLGGIEFKKYKGEFYFIEMSVRLEGFFKINEISGTLLSLASYVDLSELDKSGFALTKKQQDGYIYMDLISTIRARITYNQKSLLFRDLFDILFLRKVKLNVYDSHDVKPFFVQLKNLRKK